MAKKKKKTAGGGEEGEAPKKGKKKLIIMITVIVLIGGFVAKSVLLKPPPLTAKQVAYNTQLAEATLANLCASHNGLPVQPLPVAPGTKAVKASAASTTTTTAPAAAGPVDSLDSITINLAAGHYLKVALALQIPVGVVPDDVKKTENWEAVALKVAIDSLSGRTVADLTAGRRKAEQTIGDEVCRGTEGKVLTIYFTDFVMQ